jgi:ATP-dependent Clp protease ATP-binding subunit ClpA
MPRGAGAPGVGAWIRVEKQAAQQRFAGLTPPRPGAMPFELEGPSAEVFRAAAREARALGHHYIRPEHLLLGLLSQAEELAGRTLAELGVTAEMVRERVAERLGTASPRPTGSLGVAPQTKRILELARAIARRLGHSRCARTEHILLAAVSPKLRSPAATLLAECGVGAERVRDQLVRLLVLEAPELADRLQHRWPLATFGMRGF